MGSSFASFAKRSDADTFASNFGGKVFAFAQITPEMAVLDGGVIKDKLM
jgi:copper chaperone NosL